VFALGERPTRSAPGEAVTQPTPADLAEPPARSEEAPSPAPEEPASSPPEGPTSSEGTASVGRPEARPELPPGEADEPAAAPPELETAAEPAPAPAEVAALKPPASPAPAPPRVPLVTVDADVTVRLLDDQGHSYEPDQAPEGHYDVVAFFEEGTPEPQGEITLEAGASPSIRCRKSLAACRIKP